ncbi:MAG: hypothetical protein EZS28_012723 [Streblomastix strix]|uniref:Condensin complex subunit 1 C-terminal domain-containing protein n=1 Tax=Streblomastix strix TaxID=222440 RepID=A0A5J4WBL0_9EUKA|nr:MAG: hypothetical protein EZS28_012723 [Streblomastix strix]
MSYLVSDLRSQRPRVVKQSLNSIFLTIRLDAQETPDTEPYSYFIDFEKLGAIDNIYYVFQNSKDDQIRDLASICIGQLYRARRFEDNNMREQVVNHLTALSKLTDDNDVVYKSAIQTLRNLHKQQEEQNSQYEQAIV